MNKIISIIGVVLVFLLIMGCTAVQSTTTAPAASVPTAAHNTDTAGSSTGKTTTTTVTVEGFKFNPTTIEIKAGDTVEWANKDPGAHTVTLDNAEFDEVLPQGASVTHTFAQKGSFGYICKYHPNMRGIVVVN